MFRMPDLQLEKDLSRAVDLLKVLQRYKVSSIQTKIYL
jgi:hypothetical protein